MRLIIAIAAALAVVTTTAGAASAHTAPTPDTVVTAIVKNHPDNGHGVPPHWALDNFTRTLTIHDNGDGTYGLKSVDKGTFTTIKDAGTPSGAGGQISRVITGTFASSGSGHAAGGALLANPAPSKTYDDTAAGGTPFPGSDAWAASFFAAGATVSAFDHYAFTYKTADEQWVDADTNNDGKDATAGNITGKLSSQLTVVSKCRIKGTNHNEWTVKNVRGDRSRTFAYKVSYKGKWSHQAKVNVTAGGSTTFTTATGGYLAGYYYNYYGQIRWINARSNYKAVCR